MAKQKIKCGKLRTYNLSNDEINLIEQLTKAGEFKSNSEFIGWLVRNYSIAKDPLKELDSIKEEKIKLKIKIEEAEQREVEVMQRMKAYKEDEKHRDEMEVKAINIIKRKVREGVDRFELEDIAKYWAFRINKDMREILYKASIDITQENRKIYKGNVEGGNINK